jgi:uncharacterized protein YdaL
MRIRPMRNRRAVTAALIGAVLAGGVAMATPSSAVADRQHTHKHSEERVGELNEESEIPAPPAPTKRRPDARVLTTPKGTVSAKATKAVTGTAVTTTAAGPSASGSAAPGGSAKKTLVLYDTTGDWAWLGETYAEQTVNLVSHFNAWTARPVANYAAGDLNTYDSVIYVGSTYDEPLPVEFLDDVLGTTKPVLWMYDNIWQLTARQAGFEAKYGFQWKGFDAANVAEVRYNGTSLTRDVRAGGIMDHNILDATKAQPIGAAVRADGTTFPWGVKSGNLTYLGEIPFSYVTHDDRYVAFSDLLFDVLAPGTTARHRALVRIEDVGPDADPAELRAVADYLYSKKIPFSVAVYPRYRDPLGALNNGKAEDYTLWRKPQVVSALKYMVARGGTLLMHGYTHQFGSAINPYDGVSANDFEFYRAHVDANNSVIYDGPVLGDSATFADGRIVAAKMEFLLAGLPQPSIFEFPHYAGSASNYKSVNSIFGKRYDRGLYFPGLLSGKAVDHTKLSGQFFPYAVRDVYGSALVPENIGNIEPEPFNNHPARLPADLVGAAKRNLVVRDGTASFFYHPYLGVDHLKATVEGIQGLGYTFVTASSMV